MTTGKNMSSLLGSKVIAEHMLDISKAPFDNRQAEAAETIAELERVMPSACEHEWRRLLKDACETFSVHPVGVLSALHAHHPSVRIWQSPRPRMLKPFVRCADPSFTDEQRAAVDMAVLQLREYAARGDIVPPEHFEPPNIDGWVTEAVWWELTGEH